MTQKLHKFKAASFETAYQQMRNALGDEAMVVRTAEVPERGVMGWLGRKQVELIATTPTPKPGPKQPPQPAAPPRSNVPPPGGAGSDERFKDTVAYFKQLVEGAQERMARPENTGTHPGGAAEGNAAVASVLPFRKPEPKPAAEDLHTEIKEMREMLEVLMAETPGAGLPAEFAPHYRNLVERGMTRKAAAGLIAAVLKGSDVQVLRDPRVFTERLNVEIRRRVRVTGGIALDGGRCKTVALVGATGVGKTTNLAKLAAWFAVRQRARVALVTADTYRVAAPEQLRVYANIIGLPITIVNDPKEVVAAMRTYRKHDLVLIDTAGGSQFNLRQINEMKDMLSAARPDEVILVLSANTQLPDLRTMVAGFRCLKPTSLFFTKLDETRRYGAIFSLLADAPLPLSYFGVGQNVPDDIRLAQPGLVANLILEGRAKRGRPSK